VAQIGTLGDGQDDGHVLHDPVPPTHQGRHHRQDALEVRAEQHQAKGEHIYRYLEAAGVASSASNLVRFPPLPVLDQIKSKISSICISAHSENNTIPSIAHWPCHSISHSHP
jgi:hypothetical protein